MNLPGWIKRWFESEKAGLFFMRDRIKPYAKLVWIIPAAAIIYAVLWKVPQWQVRAYHGQLDETAISKLDAKDLIQLQKDLITAENNARLALAQIIGGLVVLLGLFLTYRNLQVAQANMEIARRSSEVNAEAVQNNLKVAQRNLEITEEGKITDRFSKAVELLGSETFNTRLGGIYALERIAWDSQKDHWTVMEVLSAFVRARTLENWLRVQAIFEDPSEESDQEFEYLVSKPPEADVQAALTVISNRKWFSLETPNQRINLSRTFIPNAVLNKAALDRASFTFAILNGASLRNAQLNNAGLNAAHLSNAQVENAKLNGASLMRARMGTANLTGSELSEAVLIGCYLAGANLSYVSFIKADLTGAKLYGANLTETNFDQADLTGADFSGLASLTGWRKMRYRTDINLSQTNFTKAKLAGTMIKGANFINAVGLEWEQLSQALFDETTIFPPDLEERRRQEQAIITPAASPAAADEAD